MSSTTGAPSSPLLLPPPPSVAGRTPIYAQCMLRINNPTTSREFYCNTLGMTELTRLDFPDYKFSLFFYAYSSTSMTVDMEENQSKRADWLWTRPEPSIELTWNWVADTFEESMNIFIDTEPGEVYESGNQEPKGFGYLQIAVDDLRAAADMLKRDGIPFADNDNDDDTVTVKDPDGYHVRFVGRTSGSSNITAENIKDIDPVFSSVMLRVKDASKAVAFLQALGFSLVSTVDMTEKRVSEYHLAITNKMIANMNLSDMRACRITLRQEWGTERDVVDQMYVNGNVKPYRGFGHIGVIVDDIYDTMDKLESKGGYTVIRKPSPFADAGEIAFIAEPSTAYWVEIIKRVGEAPKTPYEQP